MAGTTHIYAGVAGTVGVAHSGRVGTLGGVVPQTVTLIKGMPVLTPAK